MSGILVLSFELGLSTSLCNWLLDFFSQRPQAIRVVNNISSTITSLGCVLSPLLCTLLTHDCTTTYSTNHLVKFADDTTLVGFVTKGDETHYREAINVLAKWCKDYILLLNVSKMKEIKEATCNTPHLTSIVLVWREYATQNSWRCTSVKTSHGPPTLHHWQRKPCSASTFCAN